ncbi:MAG TPA: hypothetical protein VHE81_19625 [Lacipirellulaceae bacterium]|nr:hypothetical protein [Lacipirellulaceae bacterium]
MRDFLTRHLGDVVIPVVCCLFGAIAALFGVWWSNKHSRKLAGQTGGLKRRMFGWAIGSHEIREREIWCFCFPKITADRSVVEIHLSLFNKGDLSCEGVLATINAAKDLISPYSEKEFSKTHTAYPAVLVDQIQRAVSDIDDTYRHISYSLPALHPKASHRICEFIFLRPSIDLQNSTTAKTKDKKFVEFHWQMSLSWPLEFAAVATDCVPIRSSLEVYGFHADSPPEALQMLRRVATPSVEEGQRDAEMREHHVRFLGLKLSETFVIDKRSVALFRIAEMSTTAVTAPFTSRALRPKTELLDIKPGRRKRSSKR